MCGMGGRVHGIQLRPSTRWFFVRPIWALWERHCLLGIVGSLGVEVASLRRLLDIPSPTALNQIAAIDLPLELQFLRGILAARVRDTSRNKKTHLRFVFDAFARVCFSAVGVPLESCMHHGFV